MSSSNLVQIVYEVEDEGYGVRMTPDAGSLMSTARFTDESLSGTPTTTTSSELRVDRMSAGQVVTGLEVGGDINWELSRDAFFDSFFSGAMMNAWVAEETINTTVDLVPNPLNSQEATLTLGAEYTNLTAGTIVTFTPAGADLPVVLQVTSVDTPSTVFTVATKSGELPVTGETLDVIVPSYLDIGSEQISYLIAKSYTDVEHDVSADHHSQTYTGSLVSGFSVSATYGEIVTGSYSTLANGYEQEHPSYAQKVEAAGGTINPAGTTNPINASVDFPLVTVGDSAVDFCIESLDITLDNGLTPQNCIGRAEPSGYTLGTANVGITMSAYLADDAYDLLMPAKITQEPVSITITAQNQDGGYIFHIEAAQLSFADPAATGQNEQVMIEAAGVGKVGENGESALRIYRV